MVIVIIGPMGCGKTTVGSLLAHKLGYHFDDADGFHPPENITKMRAGIPLEDADRAGWLSILRQRIQDRINNGQDLVLACSALKQAYRDLLGIDQKRVLSVFLKGSVNLLRKRISDRDHPYMDRNLLSSQIAAMEEPTEGLIIDITRSPDELTDEIITQLHFKGKDK